MFESMGAANFADKKGLLISNDPSVNPKWFKSFTLSVFGGVNSFDIENIQAPCGNWDVVVCNHVLEHVKNDAKALKELARIVHPEGFLFLSVPSPLTTAQTEAWGYPDPEQHNHYRVYGRDISSFISRELPKHYISMEIGTDKITGAKDCAFLISRTESTISWLHVAISTQGDA